METITEYNMEAMKLMREVLNYYSTSDWQMRVIMVECVLICLLLFCMSVLWNYYSSSLSSLYNDDSSTPNQADKKND